MRNVIVLGSLLLIHFNVITLHTLSSSTTKCHLEDSIVHLVNNLHISSIMMTIYDCTVLCVVL